MHCIIIMLNVWSVQDLFDRKPVSSSLISLSTASLNFSRTNNNTILHLILALLHAHFLWSTFDSSLLLLIFLQSPVTVIVYYLYWFTGFQARYLPRTCLWRLVYSKALKNIHLICLFVL